LYFAPAKTLGSAPIVALIDSMVLPTRNAPTAAPPIISSSTGWNSAPMCPPASAKPPNTEPATTK
jgi:hypothetical protein